LDHTAKNLTRDVFIGSTLYNVERLRVSTRGMHIFGFDDARVRACVGLFIELLFM